MAPHTNSGSCPQDTRPICLVQDSFQFATRGSSHMNRRTFITATAGAVLGTGRLADSAVHTAFQGREPRVRIGFLGAAYSHAAPKLKLLKNHPDFELVGAWDDATAVQAAVEKQGVKLLPQDEVLAQSEVVAVESVVRDHARYARMAH